jgi:hypothetical protein
MVFLSDAIKQSPGPKPFRFESLGEVLYYVLEYQLDPQKFNVDDIASARGRDGSEVGHQTAKPMSPTQEVK